jgi:hypothetical protein
MAVWSYRRQQSFVRCMRVGRRLSPPVVDVPYACRAKGRGVSKDTQVGRGEVRHDSTVIELADQTVLRSD